MGNTQSYQPEPSPRCVVKACYKNAYPGFVLCFTHIIEEKRIQLEKENEKNKHGGMSK